MKFIHGLKRAVSVLCVLLAILISQAAAGAVRHPQKTEPRHQSANRKTIAKTARAERRRAEVRRRAEAARLGALARQHAAEEALRARVQSMIAKDDTSGEDPEIRRIAVQALGNHAGTVVVMNPKTPWSGVSSARCRSRLVQRNLSPSIGGSG